MKFYLLEILGILIEGNIRLRYKSISLKVDVKFKIFRVVVVLVFMEFLKGVGDLVDE